MNEEIIGSMHTDGSEAPSLEVMSFTDRQVYSPEEAAVLLGLHANSVYALLRNGGMPGFKAGRKWLISKKRFDAWIDGGDG